VTAVPVQTEVTDTKLQVTRYSYKLQKMTDDDVMAVRLSASNAKWRGSVNEHDILQDKQVRQSVHSTKLRYI